MKRALVFIIFITTVLIVFPADREEFISLSNQKVKISNCGFRLIDVINATDYATKVGTVTKGMDYHKVNIYFNKNIADEVKSFLNDNLETTIDEENDLYLRINKFNVHESLDGMNELVEIDVNLSFIYKKGDKYLEKFSCEKNYKRISSSNSIKKITNLIAEDFVSCFDLFYERTVNNKLISKEIFPEQLNKSNIDKEEIRSIIENADRTNKGIYETYYDFKYNTPDVAKPFSIDYKIKSNGEESVKIKYAEIEDIETGKKIENIWGFTDGSNIYVFVGNKFLPINIDEEGYYIELKIMDSETAAWAGFVGGLIGTSIAYASAPLTKLKFNYNNGQFYLPNELIERINNLPENSIRFYSSSFNQSESLLNVLVNDKHYFLTSDSWCEYELSNAGENINITVTTAGGNEIILSVVPKTKSSDIYICLESKKGELEVNLVPSNRILGVSEKLTSENKVDEIQN